jgi:plastocyanin
MKKLIALTAAFVLIGPACLGGGGSATTTILVDYSHDQFASFIAANFPREVTVHPGTELVFKQTWTGEPHSITGGTMTDALMDKVEPYIEKSLRGEPIPDEAPKDIAKLEKDLPKSYYDEESQSDDFNQTAAQPCYLTTGKPPTNGKPCKSQKQPEFTGKQSYYNSGLIPYEGPQGNEHRVKLASNITPGSYWFYCNVHGEFQSTKVVVKPRSEKVESPEAVNKQARKEINTALEPTLKVYQRASRNHVIEIDPEVQGVPGNPEHKKTVVKGNFAGLFDPASVHWHSINEFVPKRMTVKAGRKITWNVLGFHTISFGVPKYFPVLTFERDGTVKRNPKLDPPAGGAKKYEEPKENVGRPPSASGSAFDGGTYDGTGFWSSGSIGADPWLEYTMRISKPGTYRYACLIHPPMVGTVVVR